MAINWDLTSNFFNANWGQIAVTISGENYNAIKYQGEELETLFTVDGETFKADFILLFKQSDFSNLPATGTEMTINSIVYKCAKTEQDTKAKTLKCYLVQRYGKKL